MSLSFQGALILSCFTEQSRGAKDHDIVACFFAVLLLLEKGGRAGKRFHGVFLFSAGKKEGEVLSGFPASCSLS